MYLVEITLASEPSCPRFKDLLRRVGVALLP